MFDGDTAQCACAAGTIAKRRAISRERFIIIHTSTARATSSPYNRPRMIVTFLGSGTSTGVPVVGCRCAICTSAEPRNKRLRQSVKIEANGKYFLIDTTPDLRAQLLRDPIPRLDFILFTHSHSDHIMGLDDIRPFNFRQRETIHAFANPATVPPIRRAFSYIWNDTQLGGGKPQLELHEI